MTFDYSMTQFALKTTLHNIKAIKKKTESRQKYLDKENINTE
jgi:hypothetical protein